MSIKLTRNLNKLNIIKNLKLGEDETITFSDNFVIEISKLLYDLDFQPEVSPNFKGNIQLEYDENDGKYLEIEITPNMTMNIFKIDENGNEIESRYINVSLNKINKEVKTMFYLNKDDH